MQKAPRMKNIRGAFIYLPITDQIEEIRSVFNKSRLIGLSFLIALEKGT